MASNFRSDLSGFTARMLQVHGRIVRAVNDAIELEAKGVQEKARLMAPREFGALESAIKLVSSRQRRQWTVYVDGDVRRDPRKRKPGTVADYLREMHDGSYPLGPESRRKDETSPYRVGPKFIERALARQIRDGAMRRIEAAARRALRGIG
jgi:hypothetical protein